jgi:hypothetical protein
MELLTEFILFFFQFVFWMSVISIAKALLFGHVEARIDEETEKLKEKLSKMIHRIRQEKHGDCYYWFDLDDDQFLAQGRTDAEMIEVIKKRFPSHIFIIDNEKAIRGPEWKPIPITDLTKKSA